MGTPPPEVKRLRGKKNPPSAAALNSLRDEYTRTIAPARALAAESLALERQLDGLVNEAYGLRPEEVQLMWDTAPPRVPIPQPQPRSGEGMVAVGVSPRNTSRIVAPSPAGAK